LKPLIKWSGGKSREINNFHKFYPSDFKLFIEPFVGGGAVFFNLNFSKNVISDVHKELVIFYQQIKNGKAKEIYKLMSKFENTENDYYFIRDSFTPSNEVEIAFKFFYLRKTCFRGMLRYNKKGKFNIPYGRYKRYNYEEVLCDSYEKLLRRTDILNTDFKEVFNKYNDKNNFVFLDPPYDSRFTNYGYCNFDRENHKCLHKCFIETKNKCLLIIGKTEFIKKMYKEYVYGEYNKSYAFKIHSNRIGSEINNSHLIIKNY